MNHRLPVRSSRVVLAAILLLSLSTAGLLLSVEGGASESVSQEPVSQEPALEIPEAAVATNAGARRLILVIGDGMGAEQLKAASLYKTGREEGLVLQSLPVRADVETGSASHSVTDSAAAGTALATAVKVQNGVVGLRFPGDGGELVAITEELKEQGWAIGLVTTAFTTHATPAAFGAHVRSRIDYAGIARDYLSGLRPEIILGGGGHGMDPQKVTRAGYTVVRDAGGLARESVSVSPGGRIAGLFGDGHLPYLYDGRPEDTPGLVEMAAAAVDFLARDEEGFFLMIEGARIDHAGHANDIDRLIPEVLELDAVIEMLLSHPLLQEDTLLVVTADHETGGLSVTGNGGRSVVPEVTWSTTKHTAAKVPLFATGVGAETLADVVDNTLLRGAMIASLGPLPAMERLADVATPLSPEERAASLP